MNAKFGYSNTTTRGSRPMAASSLAWKIGALWGFLLILLENKSKDIFIINQTGSFDESLEIRLGKSEPRNATFPSLFRKGEMVY